MPNQYCSQADIEGEIQDADLISITDDAGTGQINQTVLNQVISNASGEIDRYCGAIYPNLSSANPSINNMAIIIACYRLYRRRLTPDEKNLFYEDYKDTIAFLKRVQSREDTLDLSAQQNFAQVSADVRPSPYGWGNLVSNSM